RSEGMTLTLDLGSAAMSSKDPVILIDRSVRSWLCGERDLRSESDDRLEGFPTIHEMLIQSGMRQVHEGKNMGSRYVAFANENALKMIAEMIAEHGDKFWKEARNFIKSPKDVLPKEEVPWT